MLDISDGQKIAAQWFGIAPIYWGFVIAALAAITATAISLLGLPRVLTGTVPSVPIDHLQARRLRWAAIVFGMLLHTPGFFGSFNIYDDYNLIHWDDNVTTLSAKNLIKLAFTDYDGDNQELMHLSFALNWALAADRYWAWYVFNWALLVPILWMVGYLAKRLTASELAAPIAIALFASTPLVAEIMCWMSTRGHLFGLTLALLSTCAYFEYRRGQNLHRISWLALSILAFAATQIAKPIYLFLPGWLFLFDLLDRRRDWFDLIAEKTLYGLIAAWSTFRITDGPGGDSRQPLGGDYFHTLLHDFNLLVEYGRSLFVPIGTGIQPPYNVATGWLAVDGTPMILTAGFAPAASLIIIASIAAVALALWYRHGFRLPLLWLALVLFSFATVLNIPARGHAAIFQYRYTLSAHIATAILLAAFFVHLLQSQIGGMRNVRFIPSYLVVAYLTICSMQTLANTKAWRNSVNLWTRNAEQYPLDYYANYYAAKALQWADLHYAAIEHLLIARANNPTAEPEVYKRLGDNAYRIGDFDLAKECWSKYFAKRQDEISDEYGRKFKEIGLNLSRNSNDE